MDEPARLGGKDSGPNPLAVFLSSLVACEQFTATVVARELGVEFSKCKWQAFGKFDLLGHAGKEGHDYAGFQEIRVEGHAETTASQVIELTIEPDGDLGIGAQSRRATE